MLQCNNCNTKLYKDASFCSNCGSPNLTKINNNNPNIPGMFSSILSVMTAIIPIFILTFCYIYSKGSFNEGDGYGFIWFFAALYYVTLGLPIALTSIVSGIIGAIKKNGLAIIGIILNIVHFIMLYILMQ